MQGSSHMPSTTKGVPVMLSGSMAVDDYAAANLKLPDISANISGRNWRKNVEK